MLNELVRAGFFERCLSDFCQGSTQEVLSQLRDVEILVFSLSLSGKKVEFCLFF